MRGETSSRPRPFYLQHLLEVSVLVQRHQRRYRKSEMKMRAMLDLCVSVCEELRESLVLLI